MKRKLKLVTQKSGVSDFEKFGGRDDWVTTTDQERHVEVDDQGFGDFIH
jgi:hypothetical protein